MEEWTCSNQSKNKTSRKLLCLPQVLFSGIPSRLVALLFAPFLYILSSCHILLDVAEKFILCITKLVGSTVISWLTHPTPHQAMLGQALARVIGNLNGTCSLPSRQVAFKCCLPWAILSLMF